MEYPTTVSSNLIPCSHCGLLCYDRHGVVVCTTTSGKHTNLECFWPTTRLRDAVTLKITRLGPHVSVYKLQNHTWRVDVLWWVHTCNVTTYRNTVSWQCVRDSWPRNISKVGYAVTLRAVSIWPSHQRNVTVTAWEAVDVQCQEINTLYLKLQTTS
jgi:hypothetical protein